MFLYVFLYGAIIKARHNLLSHCKGKQAHTTNEISGLKEVELTELPFLIPHVAMLSYTSLLANSPSTLRCVENYVWRIVYLFVLGFIICIRTECIAVNT